jgi:hypothetical protein
MVLVVLFEPLYITDIFHDSEKAAEKTLYTGSLNGNFGRGAK